MTALLRSEFHRVNDGRYRLSFPSLGVRYEIDRLRRERDELFGELAVACEIAGAKTVNGILSVGTFNLSSPAARSGRANELRDRAKAPEIDFRHQLEELCQRVLTSERMGQPTVLLRQVERRSSDRVVTIDGFPVFVDHPTVLFADGGTGKSTIALWLAGELERLGWAVLFCDWELDQFTHREHLERLFGPEMPDVKYRRCERPLSVEVDGIAAQVRECGIDYLICDSISFACDGPPEAAETAQRYYRALRQLKVGSLNLAHITKGDQGDKRPFGSAFWFNGCRACWYAERAEAAVGETDVHVGLFNRKNNLGAQYAGFGLRLQFECERTLITAEDVTANEDLAVRLPLWQRMTRSLRRGPKTLAHMADELGANLESVDRTVRRHAGLFTRLSGPDGVTRIGLAERRTA